LNLRKILMGSSALRSRTLSRVLLSSKPVLYKYIFKEMWPTFISTLLVFALIMVASRMLSITEWIVERGVHPGHVTKLVLFLLPNVLLFALPAATLMAVLIGFLRMSGDNEIIALQSSGISLYQMLPPVVSLSLAAYLLASLIAFLGVPWGNRAFKDTIFRIVESRADFNIKERIFYELFDDVVFYVNGITPKKRLMKDVFVVDRRDPAVTHSIVAQECRIIYSPENKLVTIRFRDGTVFVVDKELKSPRTMQFKTYDLNLSLLDIMPALESREKAPRELYVGELVDQIRKTPSGERRRNDLMIELLELVTIPLAVFFMGLIGAPLGAQIRSRGRSLGITVGLLVFLLYYMSLMGARSICEQGSVSPLIGMWFPNLFLAVCCILLFRSAGSSAAARIDQWLTDLRDWKAHLVRRRKGVCRTPSASIPQTPVSPSSYSIPGISEDVPHEEATPMDEARETPEPLFVGNRRAMKFHRAEAPCGRRIAPQNRVPFPSRREALQEDYVPCRVCKP